MDASALLMGAKKLCTPDFKINHIELANDLAGNRELIRTYIYDGVIPEVMAQQDPVLAKQRAKKIG